MSEYVYIGDDCDVLKLTKGKIYHNSEEYKSILEVNKLAYQMGLFIKNDDGEDMYIGMIDRKNFLTLREYRDKKLKNLGF